MPTGDVDTLFVSADASAAMFTTPDGAASSVAGSAVIALSSGDPTSEAITLEVTPGDVFAACPGLTSAGQVVAISARYRVSTNNGDAVLTAIAETIFVGFPTVSGTAAWYDVDLNSLLTDFRDAVFVSAKNFQVGGSFTSTPPVGSNTITWESTILRVTYTVGGATRTALLVLHDEL